MAELRSGTTIGGYPAWHMGNFPVQYDGTQVIFPVTTLVGQQVGTLNKLIVSGQLDVSQNLRIGISDTTTPSERLEVVGGSIKTDGSLKIYTGSTLVGEITTTDTAWLRLNQSLTGKHIYTPQGFRADTGLASGVYSLVAGEVRADIFRGGNGSYYMNPANATTSALLAGKVGVGTTSPGDYLHVAGSDTSGFGIRISNSNSGTDSHTILRFFNDTSNAWLFLNGSARSTDGGVGTMTLRNNAGDLRLQSSGTNGIRVKATSGYVGILTDTPNEALEVTGAIRSSSGYKIGVDTVIDSSRNISGVNATFTGLATISSSLTVGTTADTTDTIIKALSGDTKIAGFEAYGSSQGTGYLYVGQSSTYGGGIVYSGDATPAFATGATDDYISFFRRTNGTSSVVFKYAHNSDTVTFTGATSATGYQISGTTVVDSSKNLTAVKGTFSDIVTIPGSKYLDFGANSTAPPALAMRSTGAKLVLWNIGSTAGQSDYAIGVDASTMWYGVSAGNMHKFYAGTTELMRVQGDGKVGIGTTAPGYTLDVGGTINTNTGFAISGATVIDNAKNITSGTINATTITATGDLTVSKVDPAIWIQGGNANGSQGRVVFNSDSAQSVQIRHNTYDSTRAPFGLHIERGSTNTNPTLNAYLDVQGNIYSGGSVTATSFIGNLTGNATSADNATKAGGLVVTPAATRNNVANQIVTTDASGYIQAGWINTTSGEETTNAISRVYASTSAYTGDSYIRYYTLANFSKQVRGLSTIADKTADYPVSQMLRWSNGGNSMVIFDASKGVSPADWTTALPTVATGANKDAAIPWSATYPTLMGWNGTSTYGVRVDSARRADSAASADNADKLDNIDSASFMRSDADDSTSGHITFSSQNIGTSYTTVSNASTPSYKTSGCYLTGGSDYAGLTKLNNIAVQTWFGFSVSPTISGQTVPQGTPAFSVDARTGNVYAYSNFYVGSNVVWNSSNQGNPSTLSTTAKTIVGAINEVFQDASNGKNSIASAITGKGVSASGTETYASLASKITGLHVGYQAGDLLPAANATATYADIPTFTGTVSNVGVTGTVYVTSYGGYIYHYSVSWGVLVGANDTIQVTYNTYVESTGALYSSGVATVDTMVHLNHNYHNSGTFIHRGKLYLVYEQTDTTTAWQLQDVKVRSVTGLTGAVTNVWNATGQLQGVSSTSWDDTWIGYCVNNNRQYWYFTFCNSSFYGYVMRLDAINGNVAYLVNITNPWTILDSCSENGGFVVFVPQVPSNPSSGNETYYIYNQAGAQIYSGSIAYNNYSNANTLGLYYWENKTFVRAGTVYGAGDYMAAQTYNFESGVFTDVWRDVYDKGNPTAPFTFGNGYLYMGSYYYLNTFNMSTGAYYGLDLSPIMPVSTYSNHAKALAGNPPTGGSNKMNNITIKYSASSALSGESITHVSVNNQLIGYTIS